MRNIVRMGLAVVGVSAALVAIPSEASASTTCSASLTGTSASYWNCSTTDGWSSFRAVAPCYQSNTQTHYTAWVAISTRRPTRPLPAR